MANALVTIRETMLWYTSIRYHPLDAVYHMMLCNGNGYEWDKKGELVSYPVEKTEYVFSEIPLVAAQEKFVHDNIDLLMDDMTGIFGGPSITTHLNHVYHGHSCLETVPENVSNGWDKIVAQVFRELEQFVLPVRGNEFYYKYQYDSAQKILVNFRETDYYKNILGPRRTHQRIWAAKFMDEMRAVEEKIDD
jgi:hypothetical protein